MVSVRKLPWVIFGTVISLALWTFISVNTGIFATEEIIGGKTVPAFEYFTYLTSYALVIGFWGFVVLKIQISDLLYKILSVMMFVFSPFFCMQIAMTLSGDAEYSFYIYFINIMFYVSLVAVFLVIFRRFAASAIAAVIVSYVFNMISFIVNILRGTPLIPSDLLAVGTAAQVAGNYTFQLRYPIIYATVVTALVVAMTAKFSYTPGFKFRNIILPLCGLAIAGGFFLHLASKDFTVIQMDVFDQYHANNTHGTAYSFYINVRKMMLTKPNGYTEDGAKLILDKYPGEGLKEDEDRPNIIVIMNESFADLKAVGDFKTNVEYMPFINDLKRNTIKGEMLVSPFGGYTCNTEFEFLTSLSMGLLPTGSAPYLQYISRPFQNSLPRYLSDNGYKTVALHPYYARCWNREKVYGFLGFDEFISLETFDTLIPKDDWDYVRYYLSDRTSYEGIKKCLENKGDRPLFLFNVTMQNHGGYTYEGGAFPTVTLSGMEGHYPEAEQYLSLIKESDTAFEELVKYLKEEVDEHTIVVMFGDHQPAVEQDFYEELYGKPLWQVGKEELQKRYVVPFVIWANYSIDSRYDVKTSTNYLSDIVLDAAGMSKSSIGNFTDELREAIPQINAAGHYDAEGVWHSNGTEDLWDYNYIEYYALTDKNKSSAEE